MSKFLFAAAALPLLLLTGCKDVNLAVPWWMPHPWSPVPTFETPDTDGNGTNPDANSGGTAGAQG